MHSEWMTSCNVAAGAKRDSESMPLGEWGRPRQTWNAKCINSFLKSPSDQYEYEHQVFSSEIYERQDS